MHLLTDTCSCVELLWWQRCTFCLRVIAVNVRGFYASMTMTKTYENWQTRTPYIINEKKIVCSISVQFNNMRGFRKKSGKGKVGGGGSEGYLSFPGGPRQFLGNLLWTFKTKICISHFSKFAHEQVNNKKDGIKDNNMKLSVIYVLKIILPVLRCTFVVNFLFKLNWK